MKNIYPNQLKQHLNKKLNFFYIFLGEDYFLTQNNEDVILSFARQKGFLEKTKIDIEKNKDWEKIILFYKTQNLFFHKNIIIINFNIQTLDANLIKKICQISSFLNSNILTILKFNHLSLDVKKNQLLNKFKNNSYIILCFTPYNLCFINWIKYEIQEKNIKIEEKAFFLLCKYYEGNTLFIYQILDIILITWPNTYITVKKIKKIIIDFFNFYPLHWINSIFENKKKKALYILDVFYKQKYNPLILIRALQKDILKLIYMKRKKNINIDVFLEKNKIWRTRQKFFKDGYNNINYNNLLKSIHILIKIEINIKKNHDNFVWNQLRELTFVLS